MKHLLLALALLLPATALAEGSSTFDVFDFSGSTHVHMNSNVDPSGNTSPNVSGWNSGTCCTAAATPSNSSHAAGVAIGNLLQVPAARFIGGSGVITNVNYISSGGATSMFVLRIWDKNPASTTCTDNSAFVSNETDDLHLIFLQSMSPVAPGINTGDSKTYWLMSGLTLDYKNQDGSPSNKLYACVVTVSTDTADQNKPIHLTLTGPQN